MVQISIRDLVKRFGKQTVLSGINLEIAPGEIFFLLGPSGCGKTTLLRSIAGFTEPTRGSIYFDDKEVTRVPPHRRGVGMMFQSYALWPHLNVARNVSFGLEERSRPREEIEQRVTEILRLVQLEGLGMRRISQLSGGQQQRVALARALVVRPRCLLLDEPLSNLDAKLRQEMREEIRTVCKRFGLTAIYVTHDQDEALSMADRIGVMESGQLVQVGTPEEVYRNPCNSFAAEFVGESNLLRGAVRGPAANPGFYTVDTTAGVLTGRITTPDWEPAAAEPVRLLVRPEMITFGHMLASSNRLFGAITSRTYLGGTVQYTLRLTDGTLFKVCESNPQHLREPGETEVRVMASHSDLVIMRH